ncbi:MAG TPA: MerR family transcriptional regulator [Candidatus Pullilachnospira stercoravium]|uniref:MerR family transcriptional regulator n=1 Tax=Candidatus Pullilachnospira stercoravium TaxID=2840913 RepID=A0A9D1NST9_9FIRM|nr:MerR family transcriptional regulator [Candidatus Pullilachnospira stercoravium]
MTIKEVEEQTGLSRSNVRFYEKEKLITPARNESNGYRDYSASDIENIKKIAYLRTLGISIEDIRNVIEEKAPLREVLQKQNDMLNGQIADLNRAKILCEKMLDAENMEYDDLKVEQYVTELEDYWNDNRPVFKVDSVSFLYIWGSFVTWAVITIVCLLTALLSYANLPQEIPVQWSDGQASSVVNKIFIFAYPAVCIVIRYLIRPVIYAKLRMNNRYEEIIAEYLSNYMCFIVLSAEVFSVLFIYGVVKNIVAVLAVDTAVFIGLLIAGLIKTDLKGDW